MREHLKTLLVYNLLWYSLKTHCTGYHRGDHLTVLARVHPPGGLGVRAVSDGLNLSELNPNSILTFGTLERTRFRLYQSKQASKQVRSQIANTRWNNNLVRKRA